MIELRKSGVIVDPGDIERLRLGFCEKHFVVLPKLVEPALMDFLVERLAQAPWRDMEHKGIGTEVVSEDQLSLSLLHFLANTSAFLNAISQITGCRDLNWFLGRIYRFVPNSGHHDTWHSDDLSGRKIGMSLNLSAQVYEGGVFHLRDRESRRTLVDFANIGFGDATLFRISGQLEHQVTEVTGERPKTAFAGWFQSGEPDFLSRLRDNTK